MFSGLSRRGGLLCGRWFSTTAASTPSSSVQQQPLPFTSIPLEDSPQNILDYLQGRNFNLVSIADYLYNKKGTVARSGENIMGRDIVWVMSQSGLRDVINQEGATPDGSGFISYPLVKYNNDYQEGKLWNFSEGNLWKDGRVLGQKHFFGKAEAGLYVDAINEVSRRVCDYFPQMMEKPLDETLFAQKASFEYIYSVLLGENPGIIDGSAGPKEKQFIDDAIKFIVLGFYDIIQDAEEFQTLLKTGTSEKYRELVRATDFVINYGKDACKKIFEQVKNGTADQRILKSYAGQHFIEDPNADFDLVAATLAVYLGGGVDTTSSLITMAMVKLAEDQSLQDELVDEMNEIRGDRERGFAYEDKDKYHVLKSILREINRVSPVVGGFFRKMRHSIIVDGYEIPPDVFVFCMATIDQMNKGSWDDYDTFNPRRWYPVKEGRRKDKQLSNRWTATQVSTFGRGSHKCPGARVAENEVWSFFCEILPKYKLTPTWDPKNPPYEYSWGRGLGSYLGVPKIDVEERK